MDDGEHPDVQLRAFVRAERMRFEQVPETEVSSPGDPSMKPELGSGWENLPEEVEPDVTYDDVRRRWWAPAWRPDEGSDR